ncbi:restriction endonuclease subunit S [Clostridium sp. YIM B02505]|uniref:Restriction endonuclease subunit S n=1 Tax=Clostridium yunnanense TaxID=2800325 RepID=A0ABS1EJI9_9CLOT|nr:restriction endonuclease subunit S [Clostridium yunnanense]MBK1809525.1 restriction endonuclease subunit S [Clostridium yunnanense]
MTRKMKDSGIEWIGEIPEDWEVHPNKRVMKKEKSICEKYEGENVLSLTMNGVIVRDLENPSGKMPLTFDGYQYVKRNNLLMCLFDIDVTPRCVGVIKNDGVTSPAYSQFTLNTNADINYYYYYYLNLDYTKELLHLAKNLRHSLTESQLGEISVPVPTLYEQKCIADYLDNKCTKIDETIEKQKQVIEKLREYRQSVITEAVTKGLNPNVPMKDSGVEWIGEIPEHWNTCKVKNVCKNITDGAHISPDTENGKYDFISVVNLNKGVLDFSNCLKTSEESYIGMVRSGCKPQINDVLISKDGTVGKSLVIDFDRDFVVASSFVILTPSEVINPYFLNYLLQSNCVQEQLNSYMKGTGLKRVSVANNGKLTIVNTDISEQLEIISYLDRKCTVIDNSIQQKEEIIQKLTEYKKSLIYECVTGKREV